MNDTKRSTSDVVLIAPRLALITPVGLPEMISFSFPHLNPEEKFRLTSHGASPRAEDMPPGLQRPPVRRWNLFRVASFSNSARLTQEPWLFRTLNDTTGPKPPGFALKV